MSKAKASAAQAQLIARHWGNGSLALVGGYNIPTLVVCVKNGWFIPTEQTGAFPSGQTWIAHEVSPAGLRALESYLFDQRCKRDAP